MSISAHNGRDQYLIGGSMAFWWLLVIPVFFLPLLLKRMEKIDHTDLVVSFGALAVALVVFFLVAGGVGMAQTTDYEIWSGSVQTKSRKHDSYVTSYPCNCVMDSRGNSSCSVCFENHYTVSWDVQTTIGEISIDHKDSTMHSVYKTPDPARYTNIQKGEPVSKEVAFRNYVKAAPDSILRAEATDKKFAALLPNYPNKIYDIYRIDRVIQTGKLKIPDLKDWNSTLSLLMGELGPISKANVVIVFADTEESIYADALARKWMNGKKNDAILVIGTPNYPEISWAKVVSWTDKEVFKVSLRDDILQLGNASDKMAVMDAVRNNITEHYMRKNMEDFKYLEEEIPTPWWGIALGLILGYIAATFAAVFISNKRSF
jgi:hypothetical protein